jgi:hypothetical protein
MFDNDPTPDFAVLYFAFRHDVTPIKAHCFGSLIQM